MKRLAALVLILATAVPLHALQGQESPWIKYGKWGLLAVTLGFNLAASEANEQANGTFDELTRRCFSDPQLCTVDDGGNYSDPISEDLYQETLRLDTASRRFLVAGQVALIGAAAMFIYEFTRPEGEPDDNVPFAPLVQEMRDGVGVGFEVRF
jgi:hypothetical protein